MIKATYKSLIELIVPEVKVHMEQRRGGGSNRELLSQVQGVERRAGEGGRLLKSQACPQLKMHFQNQLLYI